MLAKFVVGECVGIDLVGAKIVSCEKFQDMYYYDVTSHNKKLTIRSIPESAMYPLEGERQYCPDCKEGVEIVDQEGKQGDTGKHCSECGHDFNKTS